MGGMLVEAGMISFSEMITPDQSEGIRTYIIDRLIIDKAEAAARQVED